MERILVVNFISIHLILTIVPITQEMNYDTNLAKVMKEMDMEYGEKLTSVEATMLKDPVKLRLKESQGKLLQDLKIPNGSFSRFPNSESGESLKNFILDRQVIPLDPKIFIQKIHQLPDDKAKKGESLKGLKQIFTDLAIIRPTQAIKNKFSGKINHLSDGKPIFVDKVNNDGGELLALYQTRHSRPVTRCTTAHPLPKLSPWFLPSSDEDNKTRSAIDEDGNDQKNTQNKYFAPPAWEPPKLYIDDE
ncbi:uncharacterized protein LOC113505534 [Trichoplusia ni]|uniref:Uncharacterized protein LOC113505534 n=1 Tax=Trichoplusia ni TaxID=7111 RepID=A0A7E5WVB0_TRINI|nr:uncharacterized protein LOC113505534 [Trichoplusia ni]